jgi:hypothetical protein
MGHFSGHSEEMKREKMATLIQRKYRWHQGMKLQRARNERHRSASFIQSHWRGFVSRRDAAQAFANEGGDVETALSIGDLFGQYRPEEAAAVEEAEDEDPIPSPPGDSPHHRHAHRARSTTDGLHAHAHLVEHSHLHPNKLRRTSSLPLPPVPKAGASEPTPSVA